MLVHVIERHWATLAIFKWLADMMGDDAWKSYRSLSAHIAEQKSLHWCGKTKEIIRVNGKFQSCLETFLQQKLFQLVVSNMMNMNKYDYIRYYISIYILSTLGEWSPLTYIFPAWVETIDSHQELQIPSCFLWCATVSPRQFASRYRKGENMTPTISA